MIRETGRSPFPENARDRKGPNPRRPWRAFASGLASWLIAGWLAGPLAAQQPECDEDQRPSGPPRCECDPITPGPSGPSAPAPSGPSVSGPLTGDRGTGSGATAGVTGGGSVRRDAGGSGTTTGPITPRPNPYCGSEPPLPTLFYPGTPGYPWNDNRVATYPEGPPRPFPPILVPPCGPFCGDPPCENVCDTCGFDHACPPAQVGGTDPGVSQPKAQYLGSGPNGGNGHTAFYNLPGMGMFFHQPHTASGAPLPYYDVHFVDGSVVHYRIVSMAGGSPYALMERSTDPHDNVTLYEYDGLNRLARVKHPTGIDEVWNYSPAWIGSQPGQWDAQAYSGVEVSFVDTKPNPVDLSGRSTFYLFQRLRDPSGTLVPYSRPFAGDLLYRVYQARYSVLDDLADGPDALYPLPPGFDQSDESYVVTQLDYEDGAPRVRSYSNLVAASIAHGSVESTPQAVVEYTYEEVPKGSGYFRAATETFPLESRTIRSTYLMHDAVPERVAHVIRDEGTDSGTFNEITEKLDEYGRVVQRTVTPVSPDGLPRASDPDNGGFVAPASRTTDYTYGDCTSCGMKPTEVHEHPSGRRYEYDYDPLTGLLLESRVPSPSGTGTAVTQYGYRPRTPGQLYSAYDPEWTVEPNGTRNEYHYESVPRVESSHGLKHRRIERVGPAVTLADAVTAPPIRTTTEFDVSAPVLLPGGGQDAYVGFVTREVDGNGVLHEYVPDTAGRRWKVIVNPNAGPDTIETQFLRDRMGRVVERIDRAGSPLEQSTTFEYSSSDLLTRIERVVGPQAQEQRLFYDRYGNLAVQLERNVDSTDGPPDDFGIPPRTDLARDWLRSEWHFRGNQLVKRFEDRRALDRDASGPIADGPDARFLRTDYLYHPLGWLSTVARPNGAVQTLEYDGYGSLYRSTVDNGHEQVVQRWFVNDALEVVRHIKGDGNVELVTTIERNDAGVIVRVVEPSVPTPGPWYPAPATGVPFAVHEFDTDVMGNTVALRILDASVAPPTLLSRTEWEYDELARPRRMDRFEPADAVDPTLSVLTLWEGISRVKRSTEDLDPANPGTSTRWVENVYDKLGRVKERFDSSSGTPNRVLVTFVPGSPHPARVTRREWDGHPDGPDYVDRVVEYAYDSAGRVIGVTREPGTADALSHSFSYYSTGQIESRIDPTGKLERFLPDALDRLVEHFVPGAAPIWNGTQYLDWTGIDARTEIGRTDGRSRETRTILDFAGRLQAVMNPGASVEPTETAPHQAHARFFVHDAASRLVDVYQGDGVRTSYHSDGVGRVIARSTPSAGAELVSALGGRDILVRNALGHVVTSRSDMGPDGAWGTYQTQSYAPDSLGRTHLERFVFPSGTNSVDIESGFTGGDRLRSSVTYSNHLSSGSGDLWLDYHQDSVGRTSRVDWRTTDTGSPVSLVEYAYRGAAVRQRTTHWAPGSSFDTDYDYGPLGRLDRITQSFDPTASVALFYDDADNLIREEYQKQGSAGELGDAFAYDEHHRLQTAWLGVDQDFLDLGGPAGGFVQRLTYGLDAANNRTEVETFDLETGATETAPYSVQDAGQPGGASNRYDLAGGSGVLYDARGNTVFDGQRAYVYDHLNRLSEVYVLVDAVDAVPDGSKKDGSDTASESTTLQLVAMYQYDAWNRRISRSVIGAGTWFTAWDGWNEAQELTLDGNELAPQRQFVWGRELDELLAYRYRVPGESSLSDFFVAEGGAHCPSRVLDDTGTVVEIQQYDPYGRTEFFDGNGNPVGGGTQSTVGNPFQWKGHRVDPETGLASMRHRFYRSDWGRFMSTDPRGVWSDPITLGNGYNYGGVRPLVELDRLGLQVAIGGSNVIGFTPAPGGINVNYGDGSSSFIPNESGPTVSLTLYSSGADSSGSSTGHSLLELTNSADGSSTTMAAWPDWHPEHGDELDNGPASDLRIDFHADDPSQYSSFTSENLTWDQLADLLDIVMKDLYEPRSKAYSAGVGARPWIFRHTGLKYEFLSRNKNCSGWASWVFERITGRGYGRGIFVTAPWDVKDAIDKSKAPPEPPRQHPVLTGEAESGGWK